MLRADAYPWPSPFPIHKRLAITWTRRTRVDGAWRDYVDVPVGEAAQSYEVEIMSGSTVKRTIAASSESATYTAAMQTTDFGSAQSAITVKI